MKTKGLNFGEVIKLLNDGYAVARATWGENTFLVKQVPTTIGQEIVLGMTSLTSTVKNVIKNEFKKQQMDSIYYNQQLILFNDSLLINSYSASADDIFAEDWYVYGV